jgi:hypothetical protein
VVSRRRWTTAGSTAAPVAPTQLVGDQNHVAISKRESGELSVAADRKGAIGSGATTARWRFGRQGAAPMGRRVAPHSRGAPGHAHGI